MKKFKYKVNQYNDIVDLNSALQEYGNEGWELVSVFTDKIISDSKTVVFVVLKQEY